MSGHRPFSIAFLMAVVGFIAADFAIVRGLWTTPYAGHGTAIVTLPMLNLLLLTSPRCRKSQATRVFWIGFEVVGWVVVVAVGFLSWTDPMTFFYPTRMFYQRRLAGTGEVGMSLLVAIMVLFFTSPQVLAAWVAGRVSVRYWSTSSGGAPWLSVDPDFLEPSENRP